MPEKANANGLVLRAFNVIGRAGAVQRPSVPHLLRPQSMERWMPYFLAWLLGVPLTVLIVIYLFMHA